MAGLPQDRGEGGGERLPIVVLLLQRSLPGFADGPLGTDLGTDMAAQALGRVDDRLARRLGNPRVMNVILLGVIVRQMALEHIDWAGIIRENVKPAFAEGASSSGAWRMVRLNKGVSLWYTATLVEVAPGLMQSILVSMRPPPAGGL